jgi:hypothetical protein
LTDKILGRGFFGTVYRALDRDLDCTFAVKAINAEILAGGTMDETQRTKRSFEKEQQVCVCMFGWVVCGFRCLCCSFVAFVAHSLF